MKANKIQRFLCWSAWSLIYRLCQFNLYVSWTTILLLLSIWNIENLIENLIEYFWWGKLRSHTHNIRSISHIVEGPTWPPCYGYGTWACKQYMILLFIFLKFVSLAVEMRYCSVPWISQIACDIADHFCFSCECHLATMPLRVFFRGRLLSALQLRFLNSSLRCFSSVPAVELVNPSPRAKSKS